MPFFREFHDLSNVAKITGREYSKSRAVLVYYTLLLSPASKNVKTKRQNNVKGVDRIAKIKGFTVCSGLSAKYCYFQRRFQVFSSMGSKIEGFGTKLFH